MSDSSPPKYRFARVSSDDHRGALYIVTFLTFTYTSITFLTRVFIKWLKLGLDDAAMLAAQVSNVVQFALLLTSLSAGLATSFSTLNDEQYARMASTQYGVQIAIYISLGLSKLSTILLVRRLFPRDMQSARTICNVITAITVIWTLASAVLVSAGCSAQSLSPRNSSQICAGIEARYMAVVISDAITDLILAFVPTFLCRNLQMKLLFKIQVLGVFALRLLLIPLAGLFVQSWKTSLRSQDPGIARTKPLVYQQAHLCLSLIAATIPCIRSFLQSFDTGSGLKAGLGPTTNSHGSAPVSGSNNHARFYSKGTYELSSLHRSKNATTGSRKDAQKTPAVRTNRSPLTAGNSLDTMNGSVEMERSSTQESDRKSHRSTQELFIRKDVQWEVKHEHARRGSDTNTPGLLRLPK